MSSPARTTAAGLRHILARLDREPLRGASGVAVARRRAEAVDRALTKLFPASDRLALVAVGGFGRSELAPGSDIDLMVLHEPGAHAEAEQAFPTVLYPLWDRGLSVGHAVRSVQECREAAGHRLDALTALLDGRVLAGRSALLDAVRSSLIEDVRASPRWFLEELRASMVQRETQAGILGEMLEPNLRDSVGGLRDVQMFGWLAASFGHDGEGALVSRGWLRPAERAATRKARDFLLLARIALHRIAGRRTDRLVAEHHEGVAAALGIGAHPARPPAVWEAPDWFLRLVLLHGRHVRSAALACLDRAGTELLGRRVHTVRVDWTAPAAEAALMTFARAAAEGASVGAEDLDRLESAVPTLQDPGPAGRWSEQMRAALAEILAAGPGGAQSLEQLDLLGTWTALVPEWEDVRGRAQRDPFHRFPADTHLIRTAARLAGILFRPPDALAARSAALVSDPWPLLLGALVHDIGKVGSGRHVIEGTRVAEGITARMGLPERDAHVVLLLVREHLLLSDTATRRDLEDPDLILQVAARIGTPERLAMLHLLTLADAESTGPSATTPWRLALIRDLVGKVGRAFERGEMGPDRAERLARAEREARLALAGVAPDRIENFLSGVPAAYLEWVDPGDTPYHFELISPRPARSADHRGTLGAIGAGLHHRGRRSPRCLRGGRRVRARHRRGPVAALSGRPAPRAGGPDRRRGPDPLASRALPSGEERHPAGGSPGSGGVGLRHDRRS